MSDKDDTFITKFYISFLGIGGFVHTDIIEIIGKNNKYRIGIMWFAWFYISKTWNVTWNVDKKLWFSIWNWNNYSEDKQKDNKK